MERVSRNDAREPATQGEEPAGRGCLARLPLGGLLRARPRRGGRPRTAFELFGFTLFGGDEETTDVADPLRYAVSLTVAGDDDLREVLEEASSLVADEDRPVSGSLGLIAKARSDREQLVAALYREARYDGVVDVTIAGRPIDEICRPTPSSPAAAGSGRDRRSIRARCSRFGDGARSRATPAGPRAGGIRPRCGAAMRNPT